MFVSEQLLEPQMRVEVYHSMRKINIASPDTSSRRDSPAVLQLPKDESLGLLEQKVYSLLVRGSMQRSVALRAVALPVRFLEVRQYFPACVNGMVVVAAVVVVVVEGVVAAVGIEAAVVA